jgi:hypothetical protein
MITTRLLNPRTLLRADDRRAIVPAVPSLRGDAGQPDERAKRTGFVVLQLAEGGLTPKPMPPTAWLPCSSKGSLAPWQTCSSRWGLPRAVE